MTLFVLSVAATIAVSAGCSALELALIGATDADMEKFRNRCGRILRVLLPCMANVDSAISAVRALRMAATVFLAALAGTLFGGISAGTLWEAAGFSAALAVVSLLASDASAAVLGLFVISRLFPARLSNALKRRARQNGGGTLPNLLKLLCWKSSVVEKADRVKDDDIISLARKGERAGVLSAQERDLITNSLELDDVAVSEIMTPRTVVTALDESMTIGEVFAKHPHLGFSRIPVYKDNIDNITGIVRRRDILTAKANDLDSKVIGTLKKAAVFVPENADALSVLKQLIKKHQQLGIVVDEFASLTGVVSLEDIFEKLLGSEIFDTDDVAVDMRELARMRSGMAQRKRIQVFNATKRDGGRPDGK